MQDDDAQARAFIARLENEAQVQDLPFDGGKMRWRSYGKGAPLVLLHGGHGSWLHWARNIDALAADFSVHVPDMPGYGDSDVPRGEGLTPLLDATSVTLDALVGAQTPIALAGFSFGGLVAAHLAARRPVARLAVFGPGGHGGKRRPRGELSAWRDAAQSGNAAKLQEIMRHNLLMHMLHDAGEIDALALRIHTDACLRTRFRSKDISHAGGLWDALARRRGPLLMAVGEHDVTVVPEALMQTLRDMRPDALTQIVAGAGHWMQSERAAAVNQLLREHLRPA